MNEVSDDGIVRVMCDGGHVFELGHPGFDFNPPLEVIGSITYCDQMVSKPEHANLILECGERIVWRRKGVKDKVRRQVLRSKQLDLFDNQSQPDKPET